jgi:DNA replication protein DnaD
MSKRLYLSSKSTVYAIGKVFECEESKVFLVMLRGPSAEGTESVYALLKTDHYGNRLQYQIVARSVSNNIGYIQMDQFSITTYLNNNTTIDVVENYMGKETKRQYKMYCIN